MSQPATAATHPDRARVLTLAVGETARHLDIGPSVLARIIGVSQPTASRLLAGTYAIKEDHKEWELAALFVRLYRSLYSIVGHDDELARSWIQSSNRAFGDQPPLDMIQKVQGLVFACDYVDAHHATI